MPKKRSEGTPRPKNLTVRNNEFRWSQLEKVWRAIPGLKGDVTQSFDMAVAALLDSLSDSPASPPTSVLSSTQVDNVVVSSSSNDGDMDMENMFSSFGSSE
ncbi:hypothetical protein [cf. Phormidesmis sp. LEGE 11477]|uniref:hypothetical protein n=1 Tax=cf. Phormidesmis sp. LEGE 11477 TaxID=1828680 RepID=UPI00187F9C79|nr:hypothetical protein [cf. Phormidesmis sp. LEGE 11477]MBE9060301.1 hypothetical protein [cf. Phormidesmis sp. LEGE 11477]